MISQLDHRQLFEIGLTLISENDCHNSTSCSGNFFNIHNQCGCIKSKHQTNLSPITMKNQLTKFSLSILFLIFIISACNKEDAPETATIDYAVINVPNLQIQVDKLPKELLSTEETASLIFSREEEKLARDVYFAMIEKWGTKIFSNISTSEQTHMDAILMLLKKYQITDPVGSNAVGVFNNPALQTLYNQLVADGKVSALKAYTVGATIEDLDIYDLNNALKNIDNQDIQLVYSMLIKGSRNHLRSFYKNILKVGGTYTPQYITQAEFDDIIKSDMETGF
jgi:hypothetical protein